MEDAKFRVWCKDKNEWEKDLCLLAPDGTLLHKVRNTWVPLNKDTHIIQFYTGECVPSCGEMIYDGDILEQSYINPMNNKKIAKRYLIHFEDGCYKAKCIGHSPYGDTHLYFVLKNGGTFEVIIIGNKLINPDLLEV